MWLISCVNLFDVLKKIANIDGFMAFWVIREEIIMGSYKLAIVTI